MNERISNIGSIVDSVLNQMQDYGMTGSDRAWLLNIAISFYSDRLRGFNAPALVTERFGITMKTKIWSFPSDYIRYTKVGYLPQGSKGPIRILGLNDEIDISQPLALCDDNVVSNPTATDGYWFSGYGGVNKTWGQTLFGVGGGYVVNSFRPDFANNCLRFNESIPVGHAFIEYLSIGKGVNAGTLVRLAYRAAMEAWLIKRCCDLKPKVRALARDVYSEFKDDSWRRMFDANTMTWALNVQEGMDEIYKSSGFTIR